MAEETIINENALITVEQLPIIKEQLHEIKKLFETETQSAAELICTEETVQAVKKKRAELTKIYNALEAKRKEAKKAILAPYEEFESVYKECVTDIYKPSDKALADKIAETEDYLKREKRAAVEAYFKEYAQSRFIDFVTFEDANITVTLSASQKSLYAQAKAFIDKCADDLTLIDTQEHKDEILYEYKKTFNVAGAINAVNQRYAEIERVRAEREARAKAEAEAQNNAVAVETIAEAFSAPVVEDAPQEQTAAEQTEKQYSVAFTVMGTLKQIKALKQFLTEGEYKYEQQ